MSSQSYYYYLCDTSYNSNYERGIVLLLNIHIWIYTLNQIRVVTTSGVAHLPMQFIIPVFTYTGTTTPLRLHNQTDLGVTRYVQTLSGRK